MRLRDRVGPEAVKVAVFAEDEAAAVSDREDGFRRVARLQVFAADHVAVDDLDPLDVVRLEHRMRHRADRDFDLIAVRSGDRDVFLARAVGTVFHHAGQSASTAGGNAVIAFFTGLKRLEDNAALGAFPDHVRFFHRDFPPRNCRFGHAVPNGGSARMTQVSVTVILYHRRAENASPQHGKAGKKKQKSRREER